MRKPPRGDLWWSAVSLMLFLFIGCGGDAGEVFEQWNIITTTPQGSEHAQTTFGRQPRWSPNGDHILFGDDRLGQSNLWLWRLGYPPQELAEDLPPHNWDYCWSPDAHNVAFSAPGEVGEILTGIWVVEVSSRTAQKIYDRGRNVSWLYDGSGLAVRIDVPETGTSGIYSLDLMSREATLLVPGGHKPRCSPTDDIVAYSDAEYAQNDALGRLWLRAADGTTQRVTDEAIIQWVWSPNGRWLYGVVNQYLDPRVRSLTGWLVRIDSDAHPFASDSLIDQAAYPTVDRSGRQVAFMRESYSQWAGLWIYRDGTAHRIANYVMNPDFHPSEDIIAVNSLSGGIKILKRVR